MDVVGSAPWSFDVGLKPDAIFNLYARSTDGALNSSCVGPIPVQLQHTQLGCSRHYIKFEGQCGDDGDCNSFRGVRSFIKIKSMHAADWQGGGFSAAAVWLGANDSTAIDESIEVGVSRGWRGQDRLVYYTAWQKDQGVDYADFEITTATPVVGATTEAMVYSCAANPGPPCIQPWTVNSEREHIAAIGGVFGRWDTSTIPTFNRNYVAPNYRAKTFLIGTEATCNLPTGEILPSRIDTTTFSFPAFRWQQSTNWVMDFGLNDHFLSEFPSSPSLDWGCCAGPDPNNPFKCKRDPNRGNSLSFFGGFNSLTPEACE